MTSEFVQYTFSDKSSAHPIILDLPYGLNFLTKGPINTHLAISL